MLNPTHSPNVFIYNPVFQSTYSCI